MNSDNENCNVTGVSKKSLADQLYKLLDENYAIWRTFVILMNSMVFLTEY